MSNQESDTGKTVLLDIDYRGIATVTLNRPDKHNAFDAQVISLLQSTFDSIKNNPEVRAVILSAKGKSFSSGADLNWMRRAAEMSYDENVKDALFLATVLNTLNSLKVPTIALVQGLACGGALGLLSCCDIVLAGPHAEFAFTEVKVGLIPAVISPYVISVIGERHARRYFQTAERFNVKKAQEFGLVSEVVTSANLNEEAEKIISAILQNSPAAMAESKRLISHVSNKILDNELLGKTSKWIAEVRTSREGQEGLSAFFEHRRPYWCAKDGSNDSV